MPLALRDGDECYSHLPLSIYYFSLSPLMSLPVAKARSGMGVLARYVGGIWSSLSSNTYTQRLLDLDRSAIESFFNI